MFLTHFNAILTLTTPTHNLGFKCIGGSIHVLLTHFGGFCQFGIWNITIWNLVVCFCVLIFFCKFGNTFWNAFGILEFGILEFGIKNKRFLESCQFGIWNHNRSYLEFGIWNLIFWNFQLGYDQLFWEQSLSSSLGLTPHKNLGSTPTKGQKAAC